MKEIVIFDFCETLVNFQTADAYVDFVKESLNTPKLIKRDKIITKLRNTRIFSYLDFFSNGRFSIQKRLKLYILKGIKQEELEKLALQYYETKIKPNLIGKTIELMESYMASGKQVWIVSGGYGMYLKYFCHEFHVNKWISSNIKIKKGYATGSILGKDCMNKNKVYLLKQNLRHIGASKIIASYSDSKSDIPILSIADNAFVISHTHQKWVENVGFNEIFI